MADAAAPRPRVLFLTQRLPYAPNRGDRIRAFHILRTLSEHFEMHLLSLVHDDEEASHAGELAGLAASTSIARVPKWRNHARGLATLATDRPLTSTLLDAPDVTPQLERLCATRRPDVVLAFCSSMARFALEPPLSSLPFVLDMVDIDSEKWSALGATTRGPKGWVYTREARSLARFEARAAGAAVATLVVNEREGEALRRLAPSADVRVVPNGVDAAGMRPPGPPSGQPVVTFCGVMNYAPNEEAALWMAREVWPRVRAARPDARLDIVGSSPTRAVRELAAPGSIRVTGAVPDVRPYLWDAAVSVAPLAVARGIQNKVLEALAAGLPVVVTPVVAEGLPGEVLPGVTVATGAAPFAEAVVALLARPAEERRALAASADLAPLAWPGRLRPLVELLASAARR